MCQDIKTKTTELRYKIKDLIHEGIITIDSSNKKHETNDCFKAHHASHPSPPHYSPRNPSKVGNLGLSNPRADSP